MATALRKTGISIVGDMPWGTHFCHFHETKEDLLDTFFAPPHGPSLPAAVSGVPATPPARVSGPSSPGVSGWRRTVAV